jgi:multicomponent K+:H+ antiporter subunit D
MNHALIAPVVLPLIAAALLLWTERAAPRWQGPIGLAAAAALLAIALLLLAQADGGAPQVYLAGNWPAPFGIVLVLDRLSALMLLLTAILGLAALSHALGAEARRGPHFHALFQFQLMGLNGAFLAGDLFNLFVFFELLLAASYGLLLHGGGAERLRAGFHYVVFNLAASALFLLAVSLIYSVAGTLNLADLALRAPRLGAADVPLLQAALLLLAVVFGVKAALLPLYFWLPATYAAAGAAVAALFAIMTKVGVYSIMRVSFLLPGGQDLLAPWLLPLGLATLLLAACGALAAATLRGLAGYLVIASAGTLLAALGVGAAALAASLYYLVHSTLAAAALFLLAERVGAARPGLADGIAAGPRTGALPGVLFFLAAISLAGLPPLSGFVAKLALLRDTLGQPAMPWFWGSLLAAGLLVLLALARAGSLIFWKGEAADLPPAGSAGLGGAGPARVWAPLLALSSAALLLAGFAAPVQRYAAATAEQLGQPATYAAAVLGQLPVSRDAP